MRLLAEIALKTDASEHGVEPAAARLEESLGVLREIGAENELALAHVTGGRLCVRQGRRAEAREHLRRALETFERLGTIQGPDEARGMLAELEELEEG